MQNYGALWGEGIGVGRWNKSMCIARDQRSLFLLFAKER